MPYLEAGETKHNLRPHPLPVPRVNHAFAESCLVYKLVKIKNKLATYHKLIHTKIIERTHSHSGFSTYVVNIMIDRYSYECILYPCQWRSEGGASGPGRRPEGGAKIMTKNFLKFMY